MDKKKLEELIKKAKHRELDRLETRKLEKLDKAKSLERHIENHFDRSSSNVIQLPIYEYPKDIIKICCDVKHVYVKDCTLYNSYLVLQPTLMQYIRCFYLNNFVTITTLIVLALVLIVLLAALSFLKTTLVLIVITIINTYFSLTSNIKQIKKEWH